jgi:hypothetical protein
LASILTGDTYKEEWRFIANLNQSSPWEDPYDHSPPHFHFCYIGIHTRAFLSIWPGKDGYFPSKAFSPEALTWDYKDASLFEV